MKGFWERKETEAFGVIVEAFHEFPRVDDFRFGAEGFRWIEGAEKAISGGC